MGLLLQNIRDSILRATGTTLANWANGNTDLDLYANQSWWDLMDRIDFREKEASLTFKTTAGVAQYDIVSKAGSNSVFEALTHISIEDLNDFSHTDLILTSIFDYENEYINDSGDQTKPVNYFRRGRNLVLYPTPDNIYTITVYYQSILVDIPSSGPVVPQGWHEAIKAGAIWRAWADLLDSAQVQKWMGIQESLIKGRQTVKVKELTDTKLAGVRVPDREYSRRRLGSQVGINTGSNPGNNTADLDED